MKSETKNKINRLEAIKEAVKATVNPLYWLTVAVKVGEISEAEAGLIIYKLEGGR